MRIVETVDIIHAGEFPETATWGRATADVEGAIGKADWPLGSGSFSLNPEPGVDRRGRPDRHPNGVVPIKVPMIRHLESRGWETETLPKLPVGFKGRDVLTTGDLDALLLDLDRHIGFEWETGNVSSTHRAINKLLDGITRGSLNGGLLVLAMRDTQRYAHRPGGQLRGDRTVFRVLGAAIRCQMAHCASTESAMTSSIRLCRISRRAKTGARLARPRRVLRTRPSRCSDGDANQPRAAAR